MQFQLTKINECFSYAFLYISMFRKLYYTFYSTFRLFNTEQRNKYFKSEGNLLKEQIAQYQQKIIILEGELIIQFNNLLLNSQSYLLTDEFLSYLIIKKKHSKWVTK